VQFEIITQDFYLPELVDLDVSLKSIYGKNLVAPTSTTASLTLSNVDAEPDDWSSFTFISNSDGTYSFKTGQHLSLLLKRLHKSLQANYQQ